MLWKNEWPALQNKDAMAMGLIAKPDVLRERRSKGAAPDDHNVERPCVDAPRASERLVQPIVHVPAKQVAREVRVLRLWRGGHLSDLPHNVGAAAPHWRSKKPSFQGSRNSLWSLCTRFA